MRRAPTRRPPPGPGDACLRRAGPTGPGIRVDAGGRERIGRRPAYDSLVAKVIAVGERPRPRRRPACAGRSWPTRARRCGRARDEPRPAGRDADRGRLHGGEDVDRLPRDPPRGRGGAARRCRAVRRHAMAAGLLARRTPGRAARSSRAPTAGGATSGGPGTGTASRFSVARCPSASPARAGSLVVAVEGPDDEAVLFGAAGGCGGDLGPRGPGPPRPGRHRRAARIGARDRLAPRAGPPRLGRP